MVHAMRTKFILFIMNTSFVLSLSAQPQVHIPEVTSWLVAHRLCFGSTANAGWMLDIGADEMDVRVVHDGSLVISDPVPFRCMEEKTFLRHCLLATNGTDLCLKDDVIAVNDTVMLGIYTGQLSGMPAQLEKYVALRNGMVVATTYVIQKQAGSRLRPRRHEAVVLTLMAKVVKEMEGQMRITPELSNRR